MRVRVDVGGDIIVVTVSLGCRHQRVRDLAGLVEMDVRVLPAGVGMVVQAGERRGNRCEE